MAHESCPKGCQFNTFRSVQHYFPFRRINTRNIRVFIVNFDTDFNEVFHSFSVFPFYNYSQTEVAITVN